jgi:hypothetical protein
MITDAITCNSDRNYLLRQEWIYEPTNEWSNKYTTIIRKSEFYEKELHPSHPDTPSRSRPE